MNRAIRVAKPPVGLALIEMHSNVERTKFNPAAGTKAKRRVVSKFLLTE